MHGATSSPGLISFVDCAFPAVGRSTPYPRARTVILAGSMSMAPAGFPPRILAEPFELVIGDRE
jgi:hypothetical protein